MRQARWVLFLLAFALVIGCATAPVTRQDVTPLERAETQSLLMMERYKAQLQDTESLEALIKAGQASLGQIRVYRIKRELLIKVHPLIKTYDRIIAKGGVPSVGREQEIFDILNNLATTQ